eukprot:2275274-Karenia_brevis.AAC.1
MPSPQGVSASGESPVPMTQAGHAAGESPVPVTQGGHEVLVQTLGSFGVSFRDMTQAVASSVEMQD